MERRKQHKETGNSLRKVVILCELVREGDSHMVTSEHSSDENEWAMWFSAGKLALSWENSESKCPGAGELEEQRGSNCGCNQVNQDGKRRGRGQGRSGLLHNFKDFGNEKASEDSAYKKKDTVYP